MTPPPGPYSGKSTLALVARVSAFSFGLVYGSVKLKILKCKDIVSLIKSLKSDYLDRYVDNHRIYQLRVKEAQAKSKKKAEAKGHH